MPIFDLKCKNDHIHKDIYKKASDAFACPDCGEPCENVWLACAPGVIGDDIPGGVWIKHGLCNEDGSPRKYYSKTEIAKEATKRGLRQHVEHVPNPMSGSDKSFHTTRWT